MINRRLFFRGVLGGAAVAALLPSRLRAKTGSPTETVQTFYAALLDVMKNAERLGLKGRYNELTPAMQRAFNLALMTRLAVGPDWQKLSPEDQNHLIAAFSDLSIATYAARFDGFSGEHFEVDPQTSTAPTGVVVNTKLVKSAGDPIQLNYLMRDGEEGWQIIDVFLSGTISELATRRSEFSAVIRRDGVQGLVQTIEQRAADLKKSG